MCIMLFLDILEEAVILYVICSPASTSSDHDTLTAAAPVLSVVGHLICCSGILAQGSLVRTPHLAST